MILIDGQAQMRSDVQCVIVVFVPMQNKVTHMKTARCFCKASSIFNETTCNQEGNAKINW